MLKPLTYQGFSNETISYGFFSRQGGVSSGLFSSLNIKKQEGENSEAVDENLRRVKDALNVQSLVTLNQTHSDICHIVSGQIAEQEGDALVTSSRGIAIGVMTADCAPVLFYGLTQNKNIVIGAAHAGWGGAMRGILESTVNAMLHEGAKLDSITAVIGPCIAQKSYEVSYEFKRPFLDEDADSSKFFKSLTSNKLLFDLPGYGAFRLERMGIKNVILGGHDTYSEEKDWFSFRRSCHRGEKQGGRQISAICIV